MGFGNSRNNVSVQPGEDQRICECARWDSSRNTGSLSALSAQLRDDGSCVWGH